MSAVIKISLPDPLIKAFGAEPSELPRRTLETLVAEAYRAGKVSHAEVGEMLQLDRWQTDAFLKQAKAFRPHESEEFSGDLQRLRSLAS